MTVVFTNIPNPYNLHLYRHLRSLGTDLRVVYKGGPESEGRPWLIAPEEGDAIAGTLGSEIQHLIGAADSAVMLSGGYLGSTEIVRRLIARRSASSLWYWGERLKPNSRLQPYRSWYFGGVDGVFAIGTWARRGYQTLVPTGAPVHVLPYTTIVRTTARKMTSTPLLGLVGSLIERKGVDIVIRAMAEIPATRRPRLEIVGSGPLRQRLEAMARDVSVAVDWMGELPAAIVDDIRARWWAQLVPSRYDGWGVVVSEAMATGVPAIVSENVGAGQDLVRQGFNGTVVVGENDWATTLKRYCEPDVVEAEGLGARIVGEEFSSVRAAAWLSKVLGAGPGPAQDFVSEGWERILARCGG